MDFEKAGAGIDEHHRAAIGLHDARGFPHDELKGLLRFTRGMNDVADLIEQIQPLEARAEFFQFIAHRTLKMKPSAVPPNNRFGSHAASHGGSCPPAPNARPICKKMK